MSFLVNKNLLIHQHCNIIDNADEVKELSDYKRGYVCNLPFDDECLREIECPCNRLKQMMLRMPVHKKEFDLPEENDE